MGFALQAKPIRLLKKFCKDLQNFKYGRYFLFSRLSDFGFAKVRQAASRLRLAVIMDWAVSGWQPPPAIGRVS